MTAALVRLVSALLTHPQGAGFANAPCWGRLLRVAPHQSTVRKASPSWGAPPAKPYLTAEKEPPHYKQPQAAGGGCGAQLSPVKVWHPLWLSAPPAAPHTPRIGGYPLTAAVIQSGGSLGLFGSAWLLALLVPTHPARGCVETVVPQLLSCEPCVENFS